MGDGSVKPRGGTGDDGSWRLAPESAKNAQGLVASGFPRLAYGRALMLALPKGAGGTWLGQLMDVLKKAGHPITSAEKEAKPSIALAFTATGLEAMGLPEACLKTFAPAFVEGMRQIDRQRRLGDLNGADTVIEKGVQWSGNAPERYPLVQEPAAEKSLITVHAALLLYHDDKDALATLSKAVETLLGGSGVTVPKTFDLTLKKDESGKFREHFGFVDGTSQPVPYGPTIEKPHHRTPWHGVPAGDILIGHADIDGDVAPSPFVGVASPGAKDLPEGTAPYGFRDLGQDGTYVVIRELRQDVGAFWKAMEAAAAAYGDTSRDAKWWAARLVGRTVDGGDPLRPGKVIPPVKGEPANAFGYLKDDPQGLGCPIGAHMRRANPRDSLAPQPGDARTFLKASNNHRILRRGRKFGLPYEEDPTADRGLLFMALNTDIARQFEFVQQTWVNNRSFAALSGEADPLVGPAGTFSVPEKPIRTEVRVETFVQLAGGDYFFLPSLKALAYLAQLTAPGAAP